MSLVTLEDITIGFVGPPLLDDVSCRIEVGQRIGLLGRNGAGKTTLMRMLSGQVEPDHGQIQLAPEARVALLPQDVPQLPGTVGEIVAEGARRHEEPENAWQADLNAEQMLSRMELDGEARYEVLSSGMKRRVLLARCLAGAPDLLLLDEPTNHLDIEAIEWLEQFLLRWQGTLLFVTHDRMFLRRLATRILEIDRGQIFDWSCDYDTFVQRKEAVLEAEQKQNELFDKKLAEEEVWIRQGIKARRTRNEGRVRALEALRRERQQRRSDPGKARVKIQEAQRSGNLVVEAEQVSFAYGDQTIFRDFSTLIMRGDKVGVIGRNGAGKSTLLRVLLGKLPATEGRVRMGSNLQVAYFDQLREQLDDQKTVQENVADGYDSVSIDGKSKHVIGYLQDFLFTPQRARTPVRFLSGGERNRLLLAKLLAKPANVIVLDEPTNDLDTETLELLEERLIDYGGTVLVVSHDRAFLNNVATSTIVFEPRGLKEYVGGYDDWQRQSAAASEDAPKARGRSKASPSTSVSGKSAGDRQATRQSPGTQKDPARRLSFREQQELKSLPRQIEQLEGQIGSMHEAMAAPDFYTQSGDAIAREAARLKELESKLEAAYLRWEELEQLAG